MPVFQRRRPTATSSPSSTAQPTPESGHASGRSLAQTWLDRIVSPSPQFFRAYCLWFVKLRDREAWPSAALLARNEEIGGEIAALKRLTMYPPVEMTAAKWSAARDRLEWLEAQRKAIEDQLQNRQLADGYPKMRRLNLGRLANAGPGSKPSPSPPETTGDPFAETEPPDPFALE